MGASPSRPPIPVENNMVEMNALHSLDVDVTGPRTCADAEHFSGYIITTSGSTR